MAKTLQNTKLCTVMSRYEKRVTDIDVVELSPVSLFIFSLFMSRNVIINVTSIGRQISELMFLW